MNDEYKQANLENNNEHDLKVKKESEAPSSHQENVDGSNKLKENTNQQEFRESDTTFEETKHSLFWRWVWAGLIVTILAGALYSHPKMLSGELVYDDGSTVAKNPNVLGLVPWSEILKRDFWGGDQLISPKSHKSFRPVVTASLRLNYMHAVHFYQSTMNNVETFGFHVTNVVLHTLVSLACLPTCYYAFGAKEGVFWPSLLSSVLFAVLPIHSEAIENITGRAEPMMSLFYLLGFITYASSMLKHRTRVSVWPNARQLSAIFFTVVFTLLSLLSKELGITLTMLCAFWDFFVVEELSLRHLWLILPLGDNSDDKVARPKRHRVYSWMIRTVILAISTLGVGLWRLSLNGGSPPFLRYNANRHGIEVDFSSFPAELIHGGDSGVHGVYRWLSIAWLWVRYVQLCVFPVELCADWSGSSIPLVRSFSDHRVAIMAGLFTILATFIWVSGFSRKPRSAAMTAFGFFLFPFILSSNIFVVVGTTIAERVAYLPSLGTCMATALIFSGGAVPSKTGQVGRLVKTLLFIVLVGLYSAKCVERNFAWSNSATLWAEAFRVNPGSSHSIQNYAIQMIGSTDTADIQKAVDALDSIRRFDEINRVDADEMYSPLVLGLRRLGKWQQALEMGAEAWERCNQREEAYNRGVKIWHMHELNPNVEKFPLRRARMLAAQATNMAHLDLREAAIAVMMAVELAPSDSVVIQMAQDLENYAANSYYRFEGSDLGAPKPIPTQMYDQYRAAWQRLNG